jgi:hypothetical protein
MQQNTEEAVYFIDGSAVKTRAESEYLGCFLNSTCNVPREARRRLSNCTFTLKKLDQFWLHSDCTSKFKIEVLNAVIRSKILYGMESAEIQLETLRRIDTFQLKGLRKILGLTTTFGQMEHGVARSNDNKLVIDKATEVLNKDRPRKSKPKQLETFSDFYSKQKLKAFQDIVAAPDDYPPKRFTMNPDTLCPWLHDKVKQKKPKSVWLLQAEQEYWKLLKPTLDTSGPLGEQIFWSKSAAAKDRRLRGIRLEKRARYSGKTLEVWGPNAAQRNEIKKAAHSGWFPPKVKKTLKRTWKKKPEQTLLEAIPEWLLSQEQHTDQFDDQELDAAIATPVPRDEFDQEEEEEEENVFDFPCGLDQDDEIDWQPNNNNNAGATAPSSSSNNGATAPSSSTTIQEPDFYNLWCKIHRKKNCATCKCDWLDNELPLEAYPSLTWKPLDYQDMYRREYRMKHYGI